jgi:hypothetical protein
MNKLLIICTLVLLCGCRGGESANPLAKPIAGAYRAAEPVGLTEPREPYTDPLSGTTYYIHKNVRTRVEQGEKDGERYFMLATIDPDHRLAIVYATVMRAKDDKRTVEQFAREEFGNNMNRKDRVVDRVYWKRVNGRKYQIIEYRDIDNQPQLHGYIYAYVSDTFVFAVDFVAGGPSPTTVHRKTLSEIRYNASEK